MFVASAPRKERRLRVETLVGNRSKPRKRKPPAPPITFIAHDSFHAPSLAAALEIDPLVAATLAETAPSTSQVSHQLPQHLVPLCQTPLLSFEQEQALFRSMNFHKFCAASIQDQLDLGEDQADLDAKRDAHLQQAEEIRNHLIRANLRLVLSIAKHYTSARVPLDEQVSEGFEVLIATVDKFDFSRGFRFSTYATHALRRRLYRSLHQQSKQQARYETTTPIDELPGTTDLSQQAERQALEVQDALHQILKHLAPRERRIVQARFGIGLDSDSKRCTLQQLARELGICKERVRQLEIRALAKLRRMAAKYQLQRFEE